VKINAGCGRHKLPGFVNVDVQGDPDLTADLRAIPLPDGCADELQAMHVIEHFYLWETPAVLTEWRRLLKPGGRLVLELPNLEAACRNVLAGLPDQMGLWPLYGDPSHADPFMCHRWAYTPASIKALLAEHGFRSIKILPPQTHGRRANRDMRVEATRGDHPR
jgi:ubiquinone/menaquinone biosynthesis C-methylase UbiE